MSGKKKHTPTPRNLNKSSSTRDFADDLEAAISARSSEAKDADVPLPKEADSTLDPEVSIPPKDPSRRSRKAKAHKQQKILIYSAVALVVLGVLLVIFASLHYYEEGYTAGIRQGEAQAKTMAKRENVPWPPEIAAELDAALADLRKGEAGSALLRLQKLEADKLQISSVTYLVALAAMQFGDIDLAEKKAQESMDKQERISDSLALLAVLETQKAADPKRYKMGDASLRSEEFLRQAILADVANPYPRYELATLLRYRGRRDEAMKEIQAAQTRLNPIDSHMVMDITLSLMKVEQTPVAELSDQVPQTDDVRKNFPAAYVAMRRGDFVKAADLLRKCQQALPVDVFDYLVNDPSLRKFIDQPEVTPFFGR